ncbi:hypothetical protein STEG23_002443, partial [Scotinomys teguina]
GTDLVHPHGRPTVTRHSYPTDCEDERLSSRHSERKLLWRSLRRSIAAIPSGEFKRLLESMTRLVTMSSVTQSFAFLFLRTPFAHQPAEGKHQHRSVIEQQLQNVPGPLFLDGTAAGVSRPQKAYLCKYQLKMNKAKAVKQIFNKIQRLQVCILMLRVSVSLIVLKVPRFGKAQQNKNRTDQQGNRSSIPEPSGALTEALLLHSTTRCQTCKENAPTLLLKALLVPVDFWFDSFHASTEEWTTNLLKYSADPEENHRQECVSIGLYGVSTGLYGVSTGLYGVSTGLYGVSIGLYGVSIGLYGVSIGLYGVSTGLYGVSTGLYGVSTGLYGVSTGLYGVSTGLYGVSTGLYGVSTGLYP